MKQLADGLPQLAYQHEDDAGLDLFARDDVLLSAAGGRELVPTGVAVEIPSAYVGLVCPRSGLALSAGVTVLNAPGVIDSSYRGEVGVVLVNLHPTDAHQVTRGDRVAQLVIVPVASATIEITTDLSKSSRGPAGFGSTGTS